MLVCVVIVIVVCNVCIVVCLVVNIMVLWGRVCRAIQPRGGVRYKFEHVEFPGVAVISVEQNKDKPHVAVVQLYLHSKMKMNMNVVK